MAIPKRKVIQKRLKKKERYARMVRTRKRNLTQVSLAQVMPILHPLQYEDETTVYKLPMGFLLGEKDGKIDFDISMYSKVYITNCLTVVNDESKLLVVRLDHKNSVMSKTNEETIQEWEGRNDPYWAGWAQRVRKFLDLGSNFLETNQEKFEPNVKDDGALQRYQDHQERRRQMMAYRPFMEIKYVFDLENSYYTEVTFNSQIINQLNYQFDELADIILKQGIPKIKYSRKNNEGLMWGILNSVFGTFTNTLTFENLEASLLTKDKDIKIVTHDYIISGQIMKKMAEISFIMSYDTIESIPLNIHSNPPTISEFFLQQQMMKRSQRNNFLKKYYPNLYVELNRFSHKKLLNSPESSSRSICSEEDAKEHDKTIDDIKYEVSTDVKEEM